jgi:hypothetical protein
VSVVRDSLAAGRFDHQLNKMQTMTEPGRVLCCAVLCRTIVSVVRDSLAAGRFAQNPCLECDDVCADSAFVVA